MPDNKNHHYVPQFYFRLFSTDGRSICALTKKTGKRIETASIGDQASKDWYYGNNVIEKQLGTAEGLCSPVLASLCRTESPALLTELETGRLHFWLAMQRSRTDAVRKIAKHTNNQLFRLHIRELAKGKTFPDEAAKAEWLQDLELCELDQTKPHLELMVKAMAEAPVLRNLTIFLLRNETPEPFIFSDAPVVFYNSRHLQVLNSNTLAMDSPGLMIIHPISPTLCLLLIDAEHYTIATGDGNLLHLNSQADIAAINKLQIHSSSKCVYFHDFTFSSYVESLWQQEREALARNSGTVLITPKTVANDSDALAQAFQPHLPYTLELSFLDFEPLTEAEFVPRKRHVAWIREQIFSRPKLLELYWEHKRELALKVEPAVKLPSNPSGTGK
jgi:hypothetical protein